jgi:hypothetical protein
VEWSKHFFGRIFTEFLSLNWFISETSQLLNNGKDLDEIMAQIKSEFTQ